MRAASRRGSVGRTRRRAEGRHNRYEKCPFPVFAVLSKHSTNHADDGARVASSCIEQMFRRSLLWRNHCAVEAGSLLCVPALTLRGQDEQL